MSDAATLNHAGKSGVFDLIYRHLVTTNHKEIGGLYLWFSLAMLFVGGAMALIIRLELFQPGLQFVNPGFFNQMTTMHGLVMVFLMIMPVFTGPVSYTHLTLPTIYSV